VPRRNQEAGQVTVQQAADRLGVSHSTIRREIADGVLAARRVRGRIVVDDDDFQRYLTASLVPSCGPPPGSDDGDDDNWRPLG
jgi:excisionase family DNA binding protein